MSDLRHTLGSSPNEGMEEKAPDSDMPYEPQEDLGVLEKNQEADIQLLTAYYRTKLRQERLRAAGFLRGTQGADYRLSHPLADPDDPTHAMHRYDPPSEEEREEQEYPPYRLSHPLADRNMPTDAMHRYDPPNEEAKKPRTPRRRGYFQRRW